MDNSFKIFDIVMKIEGVRIILYSCNSAAIFFSSNSIKTGRIKTLLYIMSEPEDNDYCRERYRG